jgi:hypothetical protein
MAARHHVDGVAVPNGVGHRDGQRARVLGMRDGLGARRPLHLLQRAPVVVVLMRGDDRRERPAVDQFQDGGRLGGRVDERHSPLCVQRSR